MISIDFVRGIEREACFPDVVKFSAKVGLTHRFAVIQDTSVAGNPDMVFDEALWRTLLDFMRHYDPQAEILISDSPSLSKRKEVPLQTYLADWARIPEDDRSSAPFASLNTGGRLRLFMVTENWNMFGGPMPYHDSYTYSLFSDREIGPEVIAFLRASPHASGWRIAAEVLSADQTEPQQRSGMAHWFSWPKGPSGKE